MKALYRVAARTFLAGAIASLLIAPVSAQEAAAPADPAEALSASPKGISPEAKAVMDRMTTFMGGLQNFSIDSYGSRDEVLLSGYKLQHNEKASLVVQRPNRMRSQVSGDLRNRTFVYDGSKMYLYSPEDNAYARFDAPDTIGKLVGGVLEAGVELPLIDVLYQGFAGTLTDQVTDGIVVGDATIDGVNCDHLAFRQPSADWQLWVAKGAQPLPRRIVITTRDASDPQFVATMNWNLKPKIDDATFTFVAPKGTAEIPFDKPSAIAGAPQ